MRGAWVCSSVDRASDSGSEGRGFESLHTRFSKSLETTSLQGFYFWVRQKLGLKLIEKLNIFSAIIRVKRHALPDLT